ncbi:MAG: hypothetical protein ACRC56_05850, partial [Bosea sp. (in: a-proteobacteria)]
MTMTDQGNGFAGVQRPAAMFAAARRHSNLVRFMRRGLPIAMGVSILGLIIVPLLNPLRNLPGLTIGPVKLSGSKVTMELPKLTGFRKDAKPYEVTATAALQDIRKPNVIELVEMKARLQLETDGWANLDSKSGIFDTQKEQLKLTGDVRLKTDTGYDARLKSADIDFKAGTVTSREPVKVSINGGTTTVDADQLDVTDNGKVMAFTGRVSVLIENAERGTLTGPNSGGAAAVPAAAPARTGNAPAAAPQPANAPRSPIAPAGPAPRGGTVVVDPDGRVQN